MHPAFYASQYWILVSTVNISGNALNSKILFLLIASYFIFVLSCATPVGPTGGPPDKAGPVILFTEPQSGTTNFSDDEVHFYFDEFVERSRVANNITIEPDFGASYDIKWKRKRLTIRFNEDLPDSTTIILTLGGQISDTRNNQMGAPTIVAFSTGDEIDEGSITGRLKNSKTGEGEVTQKVVLYREPIDLTQPYNYAAESDTGGNFRFSYLKEGLYKAFYFDDRNRNKIWDEPREKAQPFLVDSLVLGKADTLSIGDLYIETADTLSPELQAVGLLSEQRMRLRFNENIALNDSIEISIMDTLDNIKNSAYPLFIDSDERFILFAQSDSALSEDETYKISFSGISDESGNPINANDVMFTGSAQSDTTLQRIQEIETQSGLFPTQPFVARYATEITNQMVIDSIVVVEGDVTFDDWPVIGIDRNRLFIGPQDEWIDGIDYQFLIWNPITQRRALYTPEIWNTSEMGELEISINSDDSLGVFYYRLENESNELLYTGQMNDFQLIENLPPLSYRLTVFKDENGNEEWDSGTVEPFLAPELYVIRGSVRIQTGFTAEVIIDF